MNDPSLSIGWASREITPSRPAMLQGQKHIRVARSAADPLTVTALALAPPAGDPAGGVILISCDLPMIPDALQILVRARVTARYPEIPVPAIIMNATHTHDAPVITDGFYPHPGDGVMTAAEGLEWIAEQASEAAEAAWERRGQGTVARAFGHAVVGHNRRAVYADGRAMMYGRTNDPGFRFIEGYEDHSLDLLVFRDAGNRMTGVALTIPCPSQVDEHLTEFSADFWHDIRLDLRRRFGADVQVLALCGAAGDQSPHFLVYGRQEEEMRRRRGVTERQEIALRVGDAVERALACTPASAALPAVFRHLCRRVRLSPRIIAPEERDWAAAERESALKEGIGADLWWPKRLGDIVDRFDGGEPMPAFEAELHTLRLGDAVMATNPFELFLDYGIEIKARSPAAQTLVVQLAAGTGIYLPTERAVRGGHYGAHPVVAPVGPSGGRDLVEQTLAMIGDLFDTPPTP